MPMIGLPDRDLLAGEAVIQVALEIERGHAGIVGIVEPVVRAQDAPLGSLVLLLACSVLLLACHDRLLAGLPAARDRLSITRKARANPWREQHGFGGFMPVGVWVGTRPFGACSGSGRGRSRS